MLLCLCYCYLSVHYLPYLPPSLLLQMPYFSPAFCALNFLMLDYKSTRDLRQGNAAEGSGCSYHSALLAPPTLTVSLKN